MSFHGGDYIDDALPGGFDVAWLSHILHAEDPETCRDVVRKAVGALNPGGLIFIHEFILDDDGTTPTFAALFSLNMLLAAPGGRSYTHGELSDMLTAAGVQEISLLDFLGPSESRILIGRL